MISNNLPRPKAIQINTLLNDNTFLVPKYQRKYSWGNDEAEDLLYDIFQVADGNESTHFFGSIVTYIPNGGNSRMIIDGQQRITTSLIFIAVIRDIAKDLQDKLPSPKNMKNYAHAVADLLKIQDDANRLLWDPNSKFLTLSIEKPMHNTSKQNYRQYFNGLITKDGTARRYEDIQYRPIKLLRMVHRTLRHKISKKLRDNELFKDKINRLVSIFQAFTNQFYVILMDAPTRADALTIYMTLNNRGKDLTTADIVKGQLAGILEDNHMDITGIISNWNSISNELNGNTKSISKFINEYWSSKYGYMSYSDLARAIIQKITTPSDATTMISELVSLVPIYTTLTCTSNSVIDSLTISNTIKLFKHLGLAQYYPIIMAMYHNTINTRIYTKHDIYSVLKDIERIEMRNLISHDRHTKYGMISSTIWNNTPNVNSIIDILNKNLLHNDIETKQMCLSYQHKYARTGKGIASLIYIIAKIYAYENGDFENGASIYTDIFSHKKRQYGVVRLSHDNIGNDIDYAGNWTILESKLCKEANKNRSLNGLYTALKDSTLKSNRRLANLLTEYSQNSHKLVLKRQSIFARDYIQIW